MLLAFAGAWALAVDLAPWPRFGTIAIVVLVVAVRILPLGDRLGPRGEAIEYVGAGLGLVVIPVFTLLGIDWLLALCGVGPTSPLVGLGVGAAIVFVVAWVSLQPLFTGHEIPHALAFASGDVVALLIAPSAAIALIGALHGDGAKLALRPVATGLDVVVLRTDPGQLARTSPNRQIRVWTGILSGHRIRWTSGRRPAAAGRANRGRVLLLLPPSAATQEIGRWLRLADRVEPRATPTYVLLPAPDTAQVRLWRRSLSGSGRTGGAFALSDVGGAAASEAALGLRVVSGSPTATTDLALAVAHRPILLFDSREPVPKPLDVDQLFDTGDISMCESGQKLRSQCRQIHAGAELQTGFNHLAFDTHTLATARVASRIYAHVSHVSTAVSRLVYLDYWWYLPDNPAHAGTGAFCGPGFDIAGVTCFDHQSDWEGVTVVLDARHAGGRPVSVNYAEHDGSIRYSWPALEHLWHLTSPAGLAPDGAVGVRPLVFSARGTHASYPVACVEVSCPPTAVPGIQDTSALEDNPHDGRVAWSGNTDAACAGGCVAMLPTVRGGTQPGSWNAWGGEWGTANCVLGVFCSSSNPPQSPGQQDRYRQPWCTDGSFDFAGGGFTGPTPVPSCVPPLAYAGQLSFHAHTDGQEQLASAGSVKLASSVR
jgi:hypothetical protein